MGLQDDLNKLISWSQTWLLRFHPEKCKVMHIGHQIDTEYKMEDSGKTVQLIKEEKDLGIFIVDNLKRSLQCTKSSYKALSVMRLIKRNFNSIDIEEFNLLYKAYIRPHLEYCIQVWSSYLRKNIECLERVQRATKLVGSLKKKPYAERLKALQLTTLEKRRLRGDLIETYKIVTKKTLILLNSSNSQIPDTDCEDTV